MTLSFRALKHVDGPCLVLAGAGSGKTRVITGRIANLVKRHKISPANILAVTFTNKAANEMKERLQESLGKKMEISCLTFHALGLTILKENYKKFKLKRKFSIYSENEKMLIIKKAMDKLNIPADMFDPKLVLWKISKYKNDNINADNISVIDPLSSVARRVMKEYEESLRRNNAVDFDDLLNLPYNRLKSDNKLRKSYQDRFHYILVDEFQDTNLVQYNFIKQISGEKNNLFVVGDDDQSIYGFRGAHFENILKFDKDQAGCKTIILNVNYRSKKTILDAADAIIANNKQRKPKVVKAFNKSEEKIEILQSR